MHAVSHPCSAIILRTSGLFRHQPGPITAGALLLVGAAIAVYFIFRTRPDPVDDKYRTAKIAPASYKAPLVISVQAFYPGANAQTVADTVAVPIEEQVNGVEHMLSTSSQSTNEGSYTLHVTFKAGTDLDMAQVLVMNRVDLAMPVIPTLVQREGISVRKQSPEPLVLVSLTSPDNRYDDLFLSKYATIHVKDELARLPGVGRMHEQAGFQQTIADPGNITPAGSQITQTSAVFSPQLGLAVAELEVGAEFRSNLGLPAARRTGSGASLLVRLSAVNQTYFDAGNPTSRNGSLSLFGGTFSAGLTYGVPGDRQAAGRAGKPRCRPGLLPP